MIRYSIKYSELESFTGTTVFKVLRTSQRYSNLTRFSCQMPGKLTRMKSMNKLRTEVDLLDESYLIALD